MTPIHQRREPEYEPLGVPHRVRVVTPTPEPSPMPMEGWPDWLVITTSLILLSISALASGLIIVVAIRSARRFF